MRFYLSTIAVLFLAFGLFVQRRLPSPRVIGDFLLFLISVGIILLVALAFYLIYKVVGLFVSMVVSGIKKILNRG